MDSIGDNETVLEINLRHNNRSKKMSMNLNCDIRDNYFYPAGYTFELKQQILNEWQSGEDWELESIVEDKLAEMTDPDFGKWTEREAIKLLCLAGFKRFFPISGKDFDEGEL